MIITISGSELQLLFVAAYIIINIFLAGIRWAYCEDAPLGFRLASVLTVLLGGCFIYSGLWVYELLAEIVSALRVRFFWDYYFTNKYNRVASERLETSRKYVARNKGSWSLEYLSAYWRLRLLEKRAKPESELLDN